MLSTMSRQSFKIKMGTALHSSINTDSVAVLIKLPEIFRVQEGLAAGKSDAAAGFLIKDIILFQLCNHLSDSHFLAHFLSGISRADTNTGTAVNTIGRNKVYFTLAVSDVGIMAAGSKTIAAAGTFMRKKHHLRIK